MNASRNLIKGWKQHRDRRKRRERSPVPETPADDDKQPWNCPCCTFLNRYRDTKCVMCDSLRDKSRKRIKEDTNHATSVKEEPSSTRTEVDSSSIPNVIQTPVIPQKHLNASLLPENNVSNSEETKPVRRNADADAGINNKQSQRKSTVRANGQPTMDITNPNDDMARIGEEHRQLCQQLEASISKYNQEKKQWQEEKTLLLRQVREMKALLQKCLQTHHQRQKHENEQEESMMTQIQEYQKITTESINAQIAQYNDQVVRLITEKRQTEVSAETITLRDQVQNLLDRLSSNNATNTSESSDSSKSWLPEVTDYHCDTNDAIHEMNTTRGSQNALPPSQRTQQSEIHSQTFSETMDPAKVDSPPRCCSSQQSDSQTVDPRQNEQESAREYGTGTKSTRSTNKTPHLNMLATQNAPSVHSSTRTFPLNEMPLTTDASTESSRRATAKQIYQTSPGGPLFTSTNRSWISNAPARKFVRELDQDSPAAKAAEPELALPSSKKNHGWIHAKKDRRNRSSKGNDDVIWKDDGPHYAYTETVRCKAHRAALPAHDCAECRRALQILRETGHDLSQDPMEAFGRHRAQYAPPETPADFWELDFIDERKEEQQKQQETSSA